MFNQYGQNFYQMSDKKEFKWAGWQHFCFAVKNG